MSETPAEVPLFVLTRRAVLAALATYDDPIETIRFRELPFSLAFDVHARGLHVSAEVVLQAGMDGMIPDLVAAVMDALRKRPEPEIPKPIAILLDAAAGWYMENRHRWTGEPHTASRATLGYLLRALNVEVNLGTVAPYEREDGIGRGVSAEDAHVSIGTDGLRLEVRWRPWFGDLQSAAKVYPWDGP